MFNRKLVSVGAALIAVAACGDSREPAGRPAGEDTTAKTDVLKAGAAAIQGEGPLEGFNVYLVGFHPMKGNPLHQMEAHHFCRQVNEDFAQCVLFDGNVNTANMTGIEYIISEKLFLTLPDGERQYWHPHNGEILSGQLVAPGLPRLAEEELMEGKMNSYGKTWHSWATDKGQPIPLGEPMLAWSFNRDGEAYPDLISKRDHALGIDTAEIRKSRQDLMPLAKPQHGVDALNGQFGGETQDIPGVVEAP
ncbi:MAG: OBAP family protein [Sphingomonadales bacterium]